MANVEFTIRAMADKYGLTYRALRFWEQKGLIVPRRDGRARFYSAEQDQQIAMIVRWSRAGFSLVEVKDMLLKAKQDPSDLDEYIRHRLPALYSEHAERQKNLNDCREALGASSLSVAA